MKYLDIKNKIATVMKMLFGVFFLLAIACTNNQITDDGIYSEPPAPVGFGETAIEVNEGNVLPGIMEVTASKNVFNDVSFELDNYEGDGSDVIITDQNGVSKQTYTIKEGEKSVALFVKVADNPNYTGDKTVRYKLKNVTGAGVFKSDTIYSGGGLSVRHTFNVKVIDNDEIPPLVSFVDSESEGPEAKGTHEVAITISEANITVETFDISFSGSAIAGVDYNVTGLVDGVLTMSVPVGETSIVVPIEFIDNSVIEDNKTIVMNLGNYSSGLYQGDITRHTVTIIEDDIPTQLIELPTADLCMIKGNKDADNNFANNEIELSYKVFASGTPDLSNTRSALLKFDVSGINPDAVMEAYMELTTYNENESNRWPLAEADTGGPVSQSIHYISDDSWEKSTVTWNTAPDLDNSGTGRFLNPALLEFTYSPLVGNSGQTGIKHKYDLTNRLKIPEADGVLSLGIQAVPNTVGKRIFYRGDRQADTSVHPKLYVLVRTDL